MATSPNPPSRRGAVPRSAGRDASKHRMTHGERVCWRDPMHPVRLGAVQPPVTLRDYGFAFSRLPARGRQLIAVTNTGPQTHEFILSRLAPGGPAICTGCAWSSRCGE
jgi:hypothetical protein